MPCVHVKISPLGYRLSEIDAYHLKQFIQFLLSVYRTKVRVRLTTVTLSKQVSISRKRMPLHDFIDLLLIHCIRHWTVTVPPWLPNFRVRPIKSVRPEQKHG